MKKGLIGPAFGTALAFAATPALAQNFYGSAQFGIADFSGFNNGTVGVLTLGTPAPQLGQNFAIEAELATTLTDPDVAGFEVSYTTFGGYGVYAHPVSERFALRARLGLVYERVEFTGPGGASERENEIGGSTSLGFTYQFQDNLRLIADHTLIGTDIAHTGVGVQMNF